MTAQPTDADYARAEPLARARWDDFEGRREHRDAIAQALADERERARAPFLTLADQYARDPIIGRAVALAIRAAAQEPTP